MLSGNEEFIRRAIELEQIQPSDAINKAFIDLCKEGKHLELIAILIKGELPRNNSLWNGYRKAAFRGHTELVRQLIDHPDLDNCDRLWSWFWSSRTSSVLNLVVPTLPPGFVVLPFLIIGKGWLGVVSAFALSGLFVAGGYWLVSPEPLSRRCLWNTTPCTNEGRKTHQLIQNRLLNGPAPEAME
jgi:hypothetical protein